ncbi:MAG: WbqC family protein [Nitrosomonadales bacterium]|nr:WbqC family protein [Nitrosomonadales bacterium]
MTTVAIHQPQYLPWLPWFAKAAASDIFVYLDNVQYQKNGVQNRNQIKSASGPIWLTVPVRASTDMEIRSVPIDGNHWVAKHQKSLSMNYAKAPFAHLLKDEIFPILAKEWPNLADLNIALTEWMFDYMGVQARRIRASELQATGNKQDLVINICKELGACRYLSGNGASAYQNEADFKAQGVELQYFHFEMPEYPQQHPGLGFVPGLSAIDVLLNTGPETGAFLKGRAT